MPSLDHQQLRKILPQAYPFVLIDTVEDYQEGRFLRAVKNISADEWPFPQGNRIKPSEHGRGTGTFPDTLIIEAAAQAALVLYHVSKVKDGEPPRQYFIGKIKAEFIEPAQIGDVLRIDVSAGKLLADGGYVNVDVSAADKPKTRIELFFGVKQTVLT